MDLRTEKLKRFANDIQMLEAVKYVMEQEVLKSPSSDDIYKKAGRFIALEILNNTWKEIEKYRLALEEDEKVKKQVGL